MIKNQKQHEISLNEAPSCAIAVAERKIVARLISSVSNERGEQIKFKLMQAIAAEYTTGSSCLGIWDNQRFWEITLR